MEMKNAPNVQGKKQADIIREPLVFLTQSFNYGKSKL